MTIGNATPVLVQTSLVGGPAVPFDDAVKVADFPAKTLVKADFPISQIVVRHGWIIDNLTITYQLTNGTKETAVHGGNTGGVDTITLGQYEIVASVQGKAGLHNYYKRPYVNSISFTILDTKTLAVRTTKVYGNGDNTNQGDPFEFAQPYTFAGATYIDGQTGVSGLSIQKIVTNV